MRISTSEAQDSKCCFFGSCQTYATPLAAGLRFELGGRLHPEIEQVIFTLGGKITCELEAAHSADNGVHGRVLRPRTLVVRKKTCF